jgi:LacI family transcriptional regulator
MLTYGGSRLHDFYHPPLSAFHYPNAQIGQRLAELLKRAMSGEEADALYEIVQAEFVSHRSEFLGA